MKAWPEILADCGRLLSPADESVAVDKRRLQRCVRPEAAFRVTVRGNADGGTDLGEIVGGIPKIVACAVHPAAPRPSARCLSPEQDEQPVGVVIRCSPREDLYLFYRACDASLVLYTLPEKFQSKLIVVPMEDGGVIRQATLGGKVCRVAFSGLTPGNYLVASFSMAGVEALQR